MQLTARLRLVSLAVVSLLALALCSLPAARADTTKYRYDGLNRLVRIDWSNGAVTDYSYDASGNRTSVLIRALAPPTALAVPVTDGDGAFTVSWDASQTSGVTYELEEASNQAFTADRRQAYSGPDRSAAIAGRTLGKTYYYRVRAKRTSAYASAWLVGGNGCRAASTVADIPPQIALPATDANGRFAVSWGASTTPGVGYVLEEATDPSFGSGKRTVYKGKALTANVTRPVTAQTYYYRVKAIKSGLSGSPWLAAANGCAVPGTAVAAPGVLTVPATDSDGSYGIGWQASASGEVTYVVEESTRSDFSADLRTAYRGPALAAAIEGRPRLATYYYRVQAVKAGSAPSPWQAGDRGCAVPGRPAERPLALTVPGADSDGDYAVSWAASPTANATYLLEEASNSAFTQGLRTAYRGPATSVPIAGRAMLKTYFYRVRAMKGGYADSPWRSDSAGCAVPGTAALAPASIAVPAADSDGSYTVQWGASATAGATYILEEATDSGFATGLRRVYSGTASSAAIVGRASPKTYYYRVKAIKGGFTASPWRVDATGCAVPGTRVAAPVRIEVPAADADGGYTVGWGASATAGVSYLLEEATNSAFTSGLRTVYEGTALQSAIGGRAGPRTYFYRVRAMRSGYLPSPWRTDSKGCAVPGTVAAAPGSISVPASDPDGSFRVQWAASATGAVTYVLEEATDATFTAGRRVAYRGTALGAAITGRASAATYYYRVKATGDGFLDSAWRTGANGCWCPVAALTWIQAAAGHSHTVALKSDGTLWAWGHNDQGQLGDGSTADTNLPKRIGSASDWAMVAAGDSFTVAAKDDGTLWAWGHNSRGQLGDGSTVDTNMPKQIGVANDWATVAAGANFVLAIKDDGTLWAWGGNDWGQLGDGTRTERQVPVQVGLDSDWDRVAGGGAHALALKTAGTLWAWGYNYYGQLGNDSSSSKQVPTRIGGDSDWDRIAAGTDFSAATKIGGSLWTWGLDYDGQLGNGASLSLPKRTPQQVGTSTAWLQVEAGDSHALAVQGDGTLWAWGQGTYGQNGDSGLGQRDEPEPVDGASDWQQVAAGGFHCVAIKLDGTLWTWGYNAQGGLGDGANADRNAPVKVP
jgi:YD repeat-containing protein